MTNPSAAYEPPRVFDLGDFVAMTATANPDNNNSKPCVDPDGHSGNDGNMSGGSCGGIGS
jgi:hypothetical protein